MFTTIMFVLFILAAGALAIESQSIKSSIPIAIMSVSSIWMLGVNVISGNLLYSLLWAAAALLSIYGAYKEFSKKPVIAHAHA